MPTSKETLQLSGLFMKMGGKFEKVSKYHWRIGEVDYWPMTGKFHITDINVKGKLDCKLDVDPTDNKSFTLPAKRVYIPNNHSPL
jgi:hypothetical protein